MTDGALRTPPPARIDWSGPTPRSLDDGDLYFQADGLDESRHVFINGVQLPERLAQDGPIAVAEVGFGLGLNFYAACACLDRHGGSNAQIEYVAIERRPPRAADFRQTAERFPEIAGYAATLADLWLSPLNGWARIRFSDRIRLTLVFGDAAIESAEIPDACVDAWFLDGFAPQTNADAWSDAILDNVARTARPGATLATFTAVGDIRRGLERRGFSVTRRPGFGRKRHCTTAQRNGAWAPRLRPGLTRITGSGVAGYAAATALRDRGVAAGLCVDDGQPKASMLPAAMVAPRLDVGESLATALYPAAFRHARQFWSRRPGWSSDGAVRLATNAAKQRKFEKLTAIAALPPDELALLSPEDASAKLGVTVERPALWLPTAGAVSPARALNAFVDAFSRIADDEAEIEVVATGVGAGAALPLGALTGSTGQMSAMRAADVRIDHPGGVVFGHWLGSVRDDLRWIGASAAPSLDPDAGAHVANLASVDEAAPGWRKPDAAPVDAFVGARARTRDRHPVMGALAPSAWMLAGLGARGFSTAPLLGEALADLICGAPPPLPASVLRKLAPDRFAQ